MIRVIRQLAVVAIICVVAFTLVANISFKGSADAWIGYTGALCGGILAGIFTIIGVVYAFALERNRGNEEQTQRQQNQLRLLIHELEENSSVLEGAESTDARVVQYLQYDVWQNLRFELTWLYEEEFSNLADIYTFTRMVYNWHLVGTYPSETEVTLFREEMADTIRYLKALLELDTTE